MPAVADLAYALQTKERFARNNSGIVLRFDSHCGSRKIPLFVARVSGSHLALALRLRLSRRR
jgi:hypothetical protein